ncbi:MAG TPA: hypothetical protein VHD90_07470 [Phototrophicaceae bacterium]|nr:hypothetical protein [Phototrophicaceae bacterium]
MPVEVDWDDSQHTIVRMKFIGRWNWEEAYAGTQTCYDLIDTVDQVVNVIVDMRQSGGLPVLAMTHSRNLVSKRHPRVRLTVFLGVNALFTTMWKAYAKAYPQVTRSSEFSFARTDAEAYQIFAALPPGSVQTT